MSDSAEDLLLILPKQVDEDLASEIEKESVFVSPSLERLTVEPDRSSVRMKLRPGGRQDETREKAQRFLAAMTKRLKGFDVKCFLKTERRDAEPFAVNVTGELAERGWLHDYGKGQVALFGPALELARLVDSKAADLYKEEFSTFDCHLPTMIDADTLHRCGYFDSHPNAVTFLGNLIEDFDQIEAFRAGNAGADKARLPPAEHMLVGGLCLNPAACFPVYPTFSGKRIKTSGEAVSWLGRVFRFESRNLSGLDRLYEFNVRELVFLGNERVVRDARKRALPLIGKLASHLDLEVRVETATDPFFATVAAAKKFWQESQEVKNEILVPVENKADGSVRSLACGSVNLHGTFFGSRFDIRDADGTPAHTGCIGLGIERLVLACFTQHGFDERRWPPAVRKAIF